ncbi:unnamed protein product, partial [Polarella glacialis]
MMQFPEMGLWRDLRDKVKLRVTTVDKDAADVRPRKGSMWDDEDNSKRTSSWGATWRERIRNVLPRGIDNFVTMNDKDVRLMADALWRDILEWAKDDGDSARALTLFTAEPTPNLDGTEAPAVDEWAFVPAADLLLIVAEGVVGITAEGLGAADAKPGHDRLPFADCMLDKKQTRLERDDDDDRDRKDRRRGSRDRGSRDRVLFVLLIDCLDVWASTSAAAFTGETTETIEEQLFQPTLSHQEGPTPDAVKENHAKHWWMLAVLYGGMVVGELVGGDAFGAIFMAMLGGTAVYMVKEGCKNMSMYCLFVFGLMTGFQAVFDFLNICAVLGGRPTETTKTTIDSLHNKETFVTTVIRHPFFDQDQGRKYNVQSAVMLASPIVMLLSCVLAHASYNAYTSSLFPEDE